MRIVFACPFGLGLKATVWARILPLAAHLAGRGHEVRVVVPPWDTPEEADSLLLYKNVDVFRVDLRGGLLPTLMRMQWRIQEFNPDIIHIVKPRAHAGIIQFLSSIKRSLTFSGRPLLVLDADDWEQAWTPGLNAHPILARFLSWQEEWGLRNCDGLTVASQWLWRRAGQIAPELPCLYLPNGAERAPQPSMKPPTAKKEILWVTRFVEVSPAWIKRFWKRVKEIEPLCLLTVAGSPIEAGLEIHYQTVLSQFDHNEGDVQFTGHLAYSDLQLLYARSACVIAPAREEAASLAKCSVKLLDSVRFGFRCVASAVGEHVRFEELSTVTFLGPEVTPEEFAETVVLALQSHPAVPSFSSLHAQGTIVPDWAFLAFKMERFYGKMLARTH